jgi:hypothetical protein
MGISRRLLLGLGLKERRFGMGMDGLLLGLGELDVLKCMILGLKGLNIIGKSACLT